MSIAALNEKIGKYRWTICALVFFATTINYLDRNVLGLLKAELSHSGVFGANKANQELYYSYVVIAFQLAYALGMLLAGRFIDFIGTKKGYAVSLIGWSFAAIGHAFAHSVATFGFWRAALGFTESGNFPAANKTIAEWFPKKERALATGLYNSGANIGAILAPLFVPWIALHLGWQYAFIATGAIGLVWLLFWFNVYASPADKLHAEKLTEAEFNYINSDADEIQQAELNSGKISWLRLLAWRQTWAFVIGKFITDPVWWFFLFWLPAYLNGENERKILAYMSHHPHYSGNGADLPGIIVWPVAIAVVYSISTVGSIVGGWLPKLFINKGLPVYKARMYAMLIVALLPLQVLLASRLGQINTWYAVWAVALACAAHQAWSANIFTTVSDMFPKKAVATVTGIGGMAGALGGILIAWVAGMLLKHYTELGKAETGYAILFIFCGVAYMLAWLVFNILAPKMKRVDI